MKKLILTICLSIGIPLIVLLLVSVFLLISLIPAYKSDMKCIDNPNIRANESAGQIILNNLEAQLKEQLIQLERQNPNYSLQEKARFVSQNVFEIIHQINTSTYDETIDNTNCTSKFITLQNDYWGESHACLRKNKGASPNFTVFQKCGRCGECANLNKYLLESIGFKVRSVGSQPVWDHNWNEIYIGGKWLPIDASISNFSYETPYEIKGSYVTIIDGEAIGKDITSQYLQNLSLGERIRNLGYILCNYVELFAKKIFEIVYFNNNNYFQ